MGARSRTTRVAADTANRKEDSADDKSDTSESLNDIIKKAKSAVSRVDLSAARRFISLNARHPSGRPSEGVLSYFNGQSDAWVLDVWNSGKAEGQAAMLMHIQNRMAPAMAASASSVSNGDRGRRQRSAISSKKK